MGSGGLHSISSRAIRCWHENPTYQPYVIAKILSIDELKLRRLLMGVVSSCEYEARKVFTGYEFEKGATTSLPRCIRCGILLASQPRLHACMVCKDGLNMEKNWEDLMSFAGWSPGLLAGYWAHETGVIFDETAPFAQDLPLFTYRTLGEYYRSTHSTPPLVE